MKRIIDYFVDNSVIVNLLTILIVVLGSLSIFSLNKEVFPSVDFNFIIVRTIYKGAAAEDVEKLLTVEVERELKEVDGIEEINALSAEGASIVSLKIDPDFDTDDVLIDVRSALDDLGSKVPSEVEPPIIDKATNSKRDLMKVALYGKDYDKLRDDAKFFRDALERNSDITEVSLDGYRDELFDIQVDFEKLQKYDLTLIEVVNAIKDRQVNVTAGNIKLPNREKLIRTLVENNSVESLENIVIISNDVGSGVKVKDVARVARVLEDPERTEKMDGKESIVLGIKSKTRADVLATSDLIKKQVEELSEKRGIDFKVFDDLSFYVDRRLSILSQNGLQGIILVIICLAMFMNLKVSIITALGAPFAFLVAFGMMDSFDITINLISMFALILVLGMLVDDSIIVAEQYYQWVEKGMEPKQAAKRAALETVGPVTSTVLTTMVAFSSLFFIDGIMGKFLWPVPAVVIICLVASWLECFIILPGHLADWSGKVKNIEKTRWYKPLEKSYGRAIDFCTQFSKTTIMFFVLMFAGSIIMAKNMRFELFPADDVTYAFLNIKGPVGAPFEKTGEILEKIENIIKKNVKEDEIVGFRSINGYMFARTQTQRTGSHYGSIAIELTPVDERERTTDEILNSLSEKIKPQVDDYTFTLDKRTGGPPRGKPVNVEISGNSMDNLKEVAAKILKVITETNKMVSVEMDYEVGKRQIIVETIESEARRLGVTNAQIATELKAAYEGLVATTIKTGDDDVDVLVRLREEERATEETLKKIKVSNRQGLRVPLMKMATFNEEDGAFVIRRWNRRRTFSIAGEVNRELGTAIEVNREIEPKIEKIVSEYPDMTFELVGENKDTADSLASFRKALIGSAFIIFIILVIQFSSTAQPLIIMSAVPFGLIGVVLSFWIFGLPIGFMALMGMLGLVGVVINDSIVLVSFINRYIKETGMNKSSLVRACLSRFRPVILTTFTTVAGLLPIAHMPGGDPFLKPMATSFAYGLLFSSLITLIFVPCCYFVYLNFMNARGKSIRLNS